MSEARKPNDSPRRQEESNQAVSGARTALGGKRKARGGGAAGVGGLTTAQGGQRRASGQCQWPESSRTAPAGRRKRRQVPEASKPNDSTGRKTKGKRAVSVARQR